VWKDNVYEETKFHELVEKTRSQQDIENDLMCLKVCFAGDTPPPNPQPGQFWLYTPQTGNWILRQMSKNGWVDMWTLPDVGAANRAKAFVSVVGSERRLRWTGGSLGEIYIDHLDI